MGTDIYKYDEPAPCRAESGIRLADGTPATSNGDRTWRPGLSARNKLCELDEVPAIERKFLHLFRVDDDCFGDREQHISSPRLDKNPSLYKMTSSKINGAMHRYG
jgi:hypothetical protein